MDKRDYELNFPTPLPYERSLYNVGFDPRRSGERFYKNLDAEGLAREWIKFERLYDTNYQAYHWLYHTGYGFMLYEMLTDQVGRNFEPTPDYSLMEAVLNCIKHVKVMDALKN